METPADFSSMTDEQLAQKAKQGDNDCLEYIITKYMNYVRYIARKYFLVGADVEDIVQEGVIGLYKAIRDFNPEKLSSFRSFVEMCVKRQIITAIKTASRLKHQPLNNYISFSRPLYEDDVEHTLIDYLAREDTVDPEDLFLVKEKYSEITAAIAKDLSQFEKTVLNLYLQGHTYLVISKLIGKPTKSIDNALQRIKHKLEKYVASRGD